MINREKEREKAHRVSMQVYTKKFLVSAFSPPPFCLHTSTIYWNHNCIIFPSDLIIA